MGAVKDYMTDLVADIRTGLVDRNDVPEWAHCEQVESALQEREMMQKFGTNSILIEEIR